LTDGDHRRKTHGDLSWAVCQTVSAVCRAAFSQGKRGARLQRSGWGGMFVSWDCACLGIQERKNDMIKQYE